MGTFLTMPNESMKPETDMVLHVLLTIRAWFPNEQVSACESSSALDALLEVTDEMLDL
jgi:hypothetical protein